MLDVWVLELVKSIKRMQMMEKKKKKYFALACSRARSYLINSEFFEVKFNHKFTM